MSDLEPVPPTPASVNARTVRVLDSTDEAVRTAAAILVRAATDAIADRRRFVLALSGGRTPLPLFDRLARAHAADIDWSAVHVFWVDERCVEPDDPESNYGNARRHLLERVPLPADNVHRIRGEMTPPVAAGVYRAELAAFFHAELPEDAVDAFDVAVLGVGVDGHVASIFPESGALEGPEWALDVLAPTDVRPRWRVTLTRPAIATARHLLVLATGDEKAAAVAQALAPGATTPAGRLAARGMLTWIVDAAAAALLDGR